MTLNVLTRVENTRFYLRGLKELSEVADRGNAVWPAQLYNPTDEEIATSVLNKPEYDTSPTVQRVRSGASCRSLLEELIVDRENQNMRDVKTQERFNSQAQDISLVIGNYRDLKVQSSKWARYTTNFFLSVTTGAGILVGDVALLLAIPGVQLSESVQAVKVFSTLAEVGAIMGGATWLAYQTSKGLQNHSNNYARLRRAADTLDSYLGRLQSLPDNSVPNTTTQTRRNYESHA